MNSIYSTKFKNHTDILDNNKLNYYLIFSTSTFFYL